MLRKFKISVNGKDYLVEMEEIGGGSAATSAPVMNESVQPTVVTPPPTAEQPIVATNPESEEGETIIAPMPGNILDVFVKVGDQVELEQPLVVLEAMKMENEIVAPYKGTITAVLVTKGTAIDVGAVIIRIKK